MLKFRNFGKKSLDEIKSILETMGLSLGMPVQGLVAAAPLEPIVIEDEEEDEEDEDEDENGGDADDEEEDE